MDAVHGDTSWWVWDNMIYALLQVGMFEKISFRFASETRPFLFIYIPTEEEIDFMISQSDFSQIKINERNPYFGRIQKNESQITYRNFNSLCIEAVENYAGIAICLDKKREASPQMTIRYGALYSLLHYGDMGGPTQLLDNMTEALKINPHDP